MTSDELRAWFLERTDLPPRKLHQRGVWSEPGGAGSALGTPASTPSWTRWLHAPPTATIVESYEDVCYHAGKLDGDPCPSCSVIRPDGSVLYTTGVVTRHRVRYRWPMRLVIHRLWRMPPRPGRPNLGSVLWALTVAEGDLTRASTALVVRWPLMADPNYARHIVHVALRRAKALYVEDVELIRPAGGKPKSDAQLDAEAGLRPRVESAANGGQRPEESHNAPPPRRDRLAGRSALQAPAPSR